MKKWIAIMLVPAMLFACLSACDEEEATESVNTGIENSDSEQVPSEEATIG